MNVEIIKQNQEQPPKIDEDKDDREISNKTGLISLNKNNEDLEDCCSKQKRSFFLLAFSVA